MKVGEIWELKVKGVIIEKPHEGNYHLRVRIARINWQDVEMDGKIEMVHFEHPTQGLVMDYYNGMPREKFITIYEKVWE